MLPTLNLAPDWMWRVGDVKLDAATPSSNGARARSLAEPRRRAAFVRFADLVSATRRTSRRSVASAIAARPSA